MMKDNLNTISKIIWTGPRNLVINEARMGIRNITENITPSTALQHETFTTQFHQLLRNNQGNINNLGNRTFLRGGNWSFPAECKPAFLDDKLLSIQVFITFCSLMYIRDMQFLALWTAMAAPTSSTPLTVQVQRRTWLGSLANSSLYHRKHTASDLRSTSTRSHTCTFIVYADALWQARQYEQSWLNRTSWSKSLIYQLMHKKTPLKKC
jgi:hypothetical protein